MRLKGRGKGVERESAIYAEKGTQNSKESHRHPQQGKLFTPHSRVFTRPLPSSGLVSRSVSLVGLREAQHRTNKDRSAPYPAANTDQPRLSRGTHVSDFGNQGVVRVGVGEHRADREENCKRGRTQEQMKEANRQHTPSRADTQFANQGPCKTTRCAGIPFEMVSAGLH